MHSQSRNWTRNAILVLAPLTLIALLAVFVGPSLFGSSDGDNTKLASANFDSPDTASPTSASAEPTAEATPEAGETSAAAGAPKDLGQVKGTFTLKGPGPVASGGLVVFVVDGKKRVVVKDEKAPYALRLNTKSLPNGKYTVNVLTSETGTPAAVSTYTMTVSNAKKAPAKPTAPPSKSPKPGASTPAADPSTTSPVSGGSKAAQYEAKVLAITNQERADAGCKALKLDSKLTKASQSHSEDMAKHNYFDHNSQDGRSPFDRMSDAGYKFSAAAENIAMGQQTPAAVMDAWMNSPGHKANILNCDYTEMGLGYAVGNGSPYWTQDFGKPL
jgi:uncharacterized protein YkwD